LTQAYNLQKASIDIDKNNQLATILQNVAAGHTSAATAATQRAAVEADTATRALAANNNTLTQMAEIASKRALSEQEQKTYAGLATERDALLKTQMNAEIQLRNAIITKIKESITATANQAKAEQEAVQSAISAKQSLLSLESNLNTAKMGYIDAYAEKQKAIIERDGKNLTQKQKQEALDRVSLEAIQAKAQIMQQQEGLAVKQLQFKYAEKASAIDMNALEAQRNLLIAQRTGDQAGIALANAELGLLRQQKQSLGEMYSLELQTLGIQQKTERTNLNTAGIRAGMKADIVNEKESAASSAGSWKSVYESMGGTASALPTLKTDVGTVAEESAKVKESIGAIPGATADAASSVAPLKTAVTGLKTEWGTVPEAMVPATTAVDNYKTAVDSVPENIAEIGTAWDNLAGTTDETVNNMTTGFGEISTSIGEYVSTLQGFTTEIKKIGPEVVAAYKGAVTALKEIVTQTGNAGTAASNIIPQINNMATAYWNAARAAAALNAQKSSGGGGGGGSTGGSDNPRPPGAFRGGPVAGGDQRTINEFGRESFLSSSGKLSMIHKAPYAKWTAPTKGRVMTADQTSQLKAMGAFKPNAPKVNVSPDGLVTNQKALLKAMKGSSGGSQVINNNVRLETAKPVEDTGKVLLDMAHNRRRMRRFM
jgi:hypothetical protein